MSYDTEKRKLYKLFEGNQENSRMLATAVLRQGQKEVIVDLSTPKVVTFSKYQVLDTPWMPLQPIAIQQDGSYSNRAVTFSIETQLPESWIPFARLNLAYRYTGGIKVFDQTSIYTTTSLQVIDAPKKDAFGFVLPESKIKKCVWSVGFWQYKYNTTPPWYDYEMKLMFTMLNPTYLTAS